MAMTAIRTLSAIFLSAYACVSCASQEAKTEIGDDAFNTFYANQAACARYIAGVVTPLSDDLSAPITLTALRRWRFSHRSVPVAALLDEVARALPANKLDATNTRDRLLVRVNLLRALEKLPRFAEEKCGPDAPDVFVDALYRPVALADHDTLASELARSANTIEEQRWQVIMYLVSGSR
jgi:hypothetical protein